MTRMHGQVVQDEMYITHLLASFHCPELLKHGFHVGHALGVHTRTVTSSFHGMTGDLAGPSQLFTTWQTANTK